MKYILLTILSMIGLSACNTTKNKSLEGNWIEVMPANPQIRQGVTLLSNGSAQSIGMATLQYEKWETIENKQLVLCGKSIGNGQTIDFCDTLDIIKQTPDSLVLGKYGMYQISYTRTDDPENTKPFNIVDSLKIQPDLGEVMERKFQGLLPAASCPGIEYTLWLYNQPHSGDGVYKLTQRYIDANNGEDDIITSYGRQYTLRGDAVNPNAVVYQLVPFASADIINMLYLNGNLELLNKDLQRAASKLNYTLTLIKNQ